MYVVEENQVDLHHIHLTVWTVEVHLFYHTNQCCLLRILQETGFTLLFLIAVC